MFGVPGCIVSGRTSPRSYLRRRVSGVPQLPLEASRETREARGTHPARRTRRGPGRCHSRRPDQELAPLCSVAMPSVAIEAEKVGSGAKSKSADELLDGEQARPVIAGARAYIRPRLRFPEGHTHQTEAQDWMKLPRSLALELLSAPCCTLHWTGTLRQPRPHLCSPTQQIPHLDAGLGGALQDAATQGGGVCQASELCPNATL